MACYLALILLFFFLIHFLKISCPIVDSTIEVNEFLFFIFFLVLFWSFFFIYWTVPGVTARPTANGTCSMLMDCEATFTAALPFKVAAIRTAGWTDGNEENCITIGHSAVFLLFRFFFVVHQVCVCVCVSVDGEVVDDGRSRSTTSTESGENVLNQKKKSPKKMWPSSNLSYINLSH